MNVIAASIVKKVGDREVIVRELSVGDARAMFASVSDGDVFDDLLFVDCRIDDLVRMTSLSREDVDDLRPSEVREVIAACKEQNPDFFGLWARLLGRDKG
ncbi:hypothetical protein LF844_09890 [Metapseudomonas lalkuanensis]|uniref:hypothetical protein n=1 Tax=Metapseudomonas lalkuanensis TaxID=2604832 RepID=UPI001CF5F397|nr:hypothetical protein [Pseudomonas lalkuanensis]UCP00100.1 hypothetical protein LF844_09890 [Pseudomonas lalkuanensis]